MRILGIDPGTKSTGLALIGYEGDSSCILKTFVVETPVEINEIRPRVCYIFRAVENWVQKFSPEFLAIEDFVYHGKTITTDAQGVTKLVGALYLLSSQAEIKMINPSDWKHTLTGLLRPKNGFQSPYESKKELDLSVRRAVELRTRYVFGSEKQHVVDAAGIALVVGDRNRLACAIQGERVVRNLN